MKYTVARDFILKNNKFILTAHETPDGDAIGSEMAMYWILKKIGKEVLIINADPTPHKFSFLSGNDRVVRVLSNGHETPEHLEEYVLMILDTNDIQNIGEVSDSILPKVKDYFIIDHHEYGGNIIKEKLIEKEASSTCEILYELIQDLEIQLDYDIALSLYVGIVYDTGSFIYPKTSAKTFEIAHHLVQLGVNPTEIYRALYESNSISSLKLQSKIMSTLELFYDQHVAVQTMLKETILQCGAAYEEADTIINIPLKSKEIQVSIFFKENLEGLLRCSLRSKGKIDVASIAQKFKGGGHKTAAGFKCRAPLAQIKVEVLEMLTRYFE